jgi:hypothetical protein
VAYVGALGRQLLAIHVSRGGGDTDPASPLAFEPGPGALGRPFTEYRNSAL